MDEEELNELMRDLMPAEAYAAGSPLSQLSVNLETKAGDGGADAFSAAPLRASDWFGTADTCWQFKVGSEGEPAKLKGEVTKERPAEVLRAGGRFVVITSASPGGSTAMKRRLKVLSDEAIAAGLPTENIQVITSETLANWVNQHPAVAARWSNLPEGLLRIERWVSSPEHNVPWQEPEKLKDRIAKLRADLDLFSGQIKHLHIHGPAGVGKTRLALEICRDAEWNMAVVYIRQAADQRVVEILDALAATNAARLVLVVDEVQERDLPALNSAVRNAKDSNRLRLITIGHCPSPDPAEIVPMAVHPLEPRALEAMVANLHSGMPRENVAFVAKFADGYVRLAKLAAETVAREGNIDTKALLKLEHISRFLNAMLGDSHDRRSLYVVALLESVGWEGDRAQEGMVVAKHLGLDWATVRSDVESFDRRFKIAPRGGRLRYISPTPLGIYLAHEALVIFPDQVKTLENVLPSDAAKVAFFDRLRAIAGSTQAKEYSVAQLMHFFSLSSFTNRTAVRRWRAFSVADAPLAAKGARVSLNDASVDERLAFRGDARRELIWGLVELGQHAVAFDDAVEALAYLAEAENESWSNNATGEFVTFFQITLGGTELPFLERLAVLKRLEAANSVAMAKLVIQALAKPLESTEHGSGHYASDSKPAPAPWMPKTWGDYFDALNAALNQLAAHAATGTDDIREELLKATRTASDWLKTPLARDSASAFLAAVVARWPSLREDVRRSVARVRDLWQKYDKSVTDELLSVVNDVHDRFVDRSLAGQVRQLVGPPDWEDEDVDLSNLAQQLVHEPQSLVNELPWLTSGDAGKPWRLGKAVGAADSKSELLTLVFDTPLGPDLRFHAAYLSSFEQSKGLTWIDNYLDSLLVEGKISPDGIVDLSWRCTPTARGVQRVLRSLDVGAVHPGLLMQLSFGHWAINVPVAEYTLLLKRLTSAPELRPAALSLLQRRLGRPAKDLEKFKDVALALALDGELIRGDQSTSYAWSEVAKGLLRLGHAREIAEAILREHLSKADGKTWFIEYSTAKDVLDQCIKQNPIATWSAIRSKLEEPKGWHFFAIGFPRGILSVLPTDEVLSWTYEAPVERAPAIARISAISISDPQSLASQLLDRFESVDKVGNEIFAQFTTGSFSGSASDHWLALADSLEKAGQSNPLPTVKRWVRKAVKSLREMAERDAEREAEDDLRSSH